MNESAFWICLTVLIIMCYGDPDLLDALIHWLMQSP
jgi:hypothetical protein